MKIGSVQTPCSLCVTVSEGIRRSGRVWNRGGSGGPGLRGASALAAPRRGRRSRPRPTAPTPAERSSCLRVTVGLIHPQESASRERSPKVGLKPGSRESKKSLATPQRAGRIACNRCRSRSHFPTATPWSCPTAPPAPTPPQRSGRVWPGRRWPSRWPTRRRAEGAEVRDLARPLPDGARLSIITAEERRGGPAADPPRHRPRAGRGRHGVYTTA